MQPMQLLEVDVTPIHDVEGTGFGYQHVEDIDLVPLAVADVNETRDVAAQVEQAYASSPAALVVRNGAHGKTDRHKSMVVASQCIDRIGQIDAERLVRIKLAGNTDQTLCEVGVDAPVANRIGIGQGVPCYRAAKSHVIELGDLTAQTGFDIAQTFPIGQLRKGHAQIVIETREVLDLVLPVVASYAATKGGSAADAP